MITEDYVSFEVAKLLKEKGFDGLCYCYEFADYEGNFTTYHTEYPENWNQSEPCVSIPTLGMAMKWLRETRDIAISIFPTIETDMIVREDYNYAIYKNKTVVYQSCSTSYEETVETAIKYCLENLI